MIPGTFPSLVLGAWVLILAASDVATRRIPNLLILAGAAVGLALRFSAEGVPGLLWGALGAAVCLGVMLVPFALRLGVGGGDVKLLAVCGLYLGWRLGLYNVLGAHVLNGIIAVALGLVRRAMQARGRAAPDWISKVPMAVAIALSTILLNTGRLL